MTKKSQRFPISYRPKEDVFAFLEDFTGSGSMSKADLIDIAIRNLMHRSTEEIISIIGIIKSGKIDPNSKKVRDFIAKRKGKKW